MRLFVAVELDEAVRRAAAHVGEEVARALAPAGRVDVSWVRPDNMHLTVRFLGETPPERAQDLAGRLSQPFATPPFELRFLGVGTFPPRGAARVVWLGVSSGGEQLAAVHEEVEGRIAGLGFEREDRPFRAHLTLGRVRGRLAGGAGQIVGAMRASSVPAFTVTGVTLLESRLSPHGATYTALVRTPLGSGREDR